MTAVRERSAGPRAERVPHAVLLVAAVVALAGTSAPALGGRVEQAGATLSIPDYWSQAAAYLEERAEDGSAMLVPGSRFATYAWG